MLDLKHARALRYNIQTYRHTLGRQTNRQACRKVDMHAGRQTHADTCGHIHRHINDRVKSVCVIRTDGPAGVTYVRKLNETVGSVSVLLVQPKPS